MHVVSKLRICDRICNAIKSQMIETWKTRKINHDNGLESLQMGYKLSADVCLISHGIFHVLSTLIFHNLQIIGAIHINCHYQPSMYVTNISLY